MGLTVVFKDEIRAQLLAGVVFVVRSAQHQGCDPTFVSGVLAMAEYRATGEGLSWPDIFAEARTQLGDDYKPLLDRAIRLISGTVN